MTPGLYLITLLPRHRSDLSVYHIVQRPCWEIYFYAVSAVIRLFFIYLSILFSFTLCRRYSKCLDRIVDHICFNSCLVAFSRFVLRNDILAAYILCRLTRLAIKISLKPFRHVCGYLSYNVEMLLVKVGIKRIEHYPTLRYHYCVALLPYRNRW